VKPDVIGTVETKLCFLDLIPEHSTVLSAGIGLNISPEIELIQKKNCKVIALDPSFLAREFLSKIPHMPNFLWLPSALSFSNKSMSFYENTDPTGEDTMGSPDKTHACIFGKKSVSYEVDCIAFNDFLKLAEDVSYLKIDIEGGEYDVLRDLTQLNIPQVTVEFHHFSSKIFTEKDTQEILRMFEQLGYKYFDYGDGCEFLFVKKSLLENR